MAAARHLSIDPSVPDTRLVLVMPSPPRVAETMPTPLETYQQSMDEIKAYIKAHGFDAAVMFFGTGVYMGIYYAAP